MRLIPNPSLTLHQQLVVNVNSNERRNNGHKCSQKSAQKLDLHHLRYIKKIVTWRNSLLKKMNSITHSKFQISGGSTSQKLTFEIVVQSLSKKLNTFDT